MYVPLASLAVLIPFMLPLAAAMVGGYMIAGEAELGTLRIILLRPVRRGAMLLTKWAAAMLYLAFGAVDPVRERHALRLGVLRPASDGDAVGQHDQHRPRAAA